MKPEPTADIDDYIRANRDTYTREAIDRELQASGHSQEAIDAAWAALPSETTPAPVQPRRVVATVQFWVLLLVVACLASTALPLLGVFAGSAATSSLETGSGGVFFGTGVAVLLLGYLLVGLGGWWLRRRDAAAASGVFGGLVVAFVLTVVVAGACAALVAQM